MRKQIYSPPDPFTLSPLLALLPVIGKVGNLPSLSTSLYARYENVKNALHGSELKVDSAAMQAFASEEAMLKQVLEWLQIISGVKK